MKRIIAITAMVMAGFSPILAADVNANWTKHCASCHGKDGKGQTKAGKKADVKDLTDKKYQASFTDEKMLAQIRDGMKDDAGKEKMKPFKDKMSEDEMKALVGFVRKLAK